ncbi:MAG TPA: RNA-binding protein [Anaerolineales bacterium]|nr:RNA-binding protein [Anaerolineales bacterium]HNA89689.1 RNA-binding protein [Anaerolineales bacterium]HNB35535.1 RNA-binding protein [Anaerolineales bacterium]HNC09934.1 RNA-binding protein [Anaerolineales bacterium]
MEYKLYVGNLAYSVVEADLQTLFAEAGVVKSIALIKDKFSGQPKGFAFVEMETQEGMQNAISLLNGREVQSRALAVSVARPREERGGFGGGNRGGGNNRFSNDKKRKPRGGNQKQRW